MPHHVGYRDRAQAHINYLCSVRPNRRTGSAGNRKAGAYLAEQFQELGYEIDQTPFITLDYQTAGAFLSGHPGEAVIHTSPYSPGCNATAELLGVNTLSELEEADAAGKILLLRGELCAEQLMPKNFVFYNPEHHQRLIALLEEKRPAALITATGQSPEAAGALSPFPLFVDGDFGIPSAYCTESTGKLLADHLGQQVRIQIQSKRLPTQASNVLAVCRGTSSRKISLMAHFDTYEDTPGAIDNASGVTILLLAADMLAGYQPQLGLEFIAFNGEDHYSAGGQMDYLSRYGKDLPQIELAVNVDGAAYREGKSAYSFYGCSPERMQSVRSVFQGFPSLVEGEAWYSGDHMVFVQQQVPCLAITSDQMPDLMTTVIHTGNDRPELVSAGQLVEAASALDQLVRALP